MPQPRRLIRLSLALVVAAAAVLGVAVSSRPDSVLAGVLGQAVPVSSGPCTPTSTLFVASMSGNQEVPPSGSAATGTAIIQLLPDGQTLVAQVTTQNLALDQVIAAHIHSPAPPGVNTSIRVNFFLGPQGAFTNPFTATGFPPAPPDVINDMRNGLAYFNVHTVQFPGGEIRGQIGCPVAPPPPPIVVRTPTPTPVPPGTVPQAPRIIVAGGGNLPLLPPPLPPLLLPPPLPPLPPPPPMGMGMPGAPGSMGGAMGQTGQQGQPGQMGPMGPGGPMGPMVQPSATPAPAPIDTGGGNVPPPAPTAGTSPLLPTTVPPATPPPSGTPTTSSVPQVPVSGSSTTADPAPLPESSGPPATTPMQVLVDEQ